MPDITNSSMTVSPLEQPFTYPGIPLSHSGLLVGTWIYQLTAIEAVEPAQWQLDTDGGELEYRDARLNQALADLNAAPMENRQPIVAIGSNASPGQLLHKYRSGPRPVIPMTTAEITNLDVGYSAHVSRAGYVPYVPRYRVGQHRQFQVLWLDAEQRDTLNATEPNYWPVQLDLQHHRATLESGQTLARYQVYRGRRGLVTAIEPPASDSQNHFYSWLLRQDWLKGLIAQASNVDNIVNVLPADSALRDRISAALLEQAGTTQDGLQQQEYPLGPD